MANETLTPLRTPRGGTVRILAGEDDGHSYSVQVPARCKTVEDALAWLRPAEVPEDAPRQGEYFFVPTQLPTELHEETPAGSYRDETLSKARFSPSHVADRCLRLAVDGCTMFAGRRGVRAHYWTGRPRYFVHGVVRHVRGDHAPLDLGPSWHEVIPNRAHGPFPVNGSRADYD